MKPSIPNDESEFVKNTMDKFFSIVLDNNTNKYYITLDTGEIPITFSYGHDTFEEASFSCKILVKNMEKINTLL
jgi:hypothetical protein